LLRLQDTAGTGLNFFEFVVNPKSFGQSVENVFFVSFLINSGHAGIKVEPDGSILLSGLYLFFGLLQEAEGDQGEQSPKTLIWGTK